VQWPVNKAWRRMIPIRLTGTAAGAMTDAKCERYAGKSFISPAIVAEYADRYIPQNHIPHNTPDGRRCWDPARCTEAERRGDSPEAQRSPRPSSSGD